MNTGAVITAVGTVLVTILTLLGGWFVKRGDRSAKLAQRYFDDAAFNMDLVGALRDDYWAVAGWAHSTSVKWHLLIEGLPRVCTEQPDAVAALMRSVGELPKIPKPRHTQIERLHARRAAAADAEAAKDD